MHERQEREIRAFEIESRAFSQDVRLTEKKGREREREKAASKLLLLFFYSTHYIPFPGRAPQQQQPAAHTAAC